MTPSELSDLLWAQVDRVAPHLLPNGKKEGHEWVAGNVNGDKGNSLKVNLSGKKKWADFAEGDGGDMLDLWMACRGINLHQAMQEAKAFLGIKDDDHHFDAKREKKFSRPDRKKIARYVKRAQFYYALADRLYLTYRAVVYGEYADPDDMLSFDKEAIGEKMLEKLFAELTQIQRKFNNNGKLELMTKVEMKQKLGIPSPNLADALMMCMHCPESAAQITPTLSPGATTVMDTTTSLNAVTSR